MIAGGEIKNGKGVNVPNVPLDMPHLSEKDKGDLLFGIAQDVDFVAASFVRRAEDVRGMRKFLDYNDGHEIRRAAVENNVTMFTALDTVRVLLDVLEETTLCISTIDA